MDGVGKCSILCLRIKNGYEANDSPCLLFGLVFV